MCGIVGAFIFDTCGQFAVTEEYIVKMRDAMVHRGPDGGGCWISPDRRVGLGHRRLSIIDLSSAASQPMCDETGDIQVVFNGEIYNHAELRKELESFGTYRWKTDHSDTEVVIHAYEQWGIGFIDRMRGMFAIGLWDARKKELLLIRDRLGIKPVYYSIYDGRIVFASEIKAILKDPARKREVNEEGLYNYLSFLAVPPPQTIFKDIYKVPCGNYLKIDASGSVHLKKYWDAFGLCGKIDTSDEETLAETLLEHIETSVRLRTISDVPVGVFLSGGIDSSVNAVLFSKVKGKVETFSVGYDREYKSYPSELKYAKHVAGLCGANHHEVVIKQSDVLDFMPKMIELQDEPIADPVCAPLYFLSKTARDNGIIVCQTGEGADELFCGYPSWLATIKLNRFHNFIQMPGWSKNLLMKLGAALAKDNGITYENMRRSASNLPLFWGGAEAFTETHKKRLISERLRKKFEKYSSWEAIKPIYRRYCELTPDTDILNWMSYLDLNFRLPELLLMRTDKMSMGASLEARVPFLDHKLVELSMSISPRLKVKNNVLKYILKKAIKGLLPSEIIERPKQGFNIPIFEWFADDLGRMAAREFKDFINNTDYFDSKQISHYVLNPLKGAKFFKIDSWYLLNFILWHKKFIG
ncbi:MAG TPA: asparagine synthase (glutamine-hydrolyzing) [Candidatus Wallbacteria bacterium]|nr:asparagine synthase (glutamine-hydrolyzing) [Candidatus Wallbacteria bacterium]